MPSQEWNIRARSASCEKCETPFQDKQQYVSRLVFGDEGYVRTDMCDTCWGGLDDSNVQVSVWRGVYHSPPPPPEEPLKKETAESLLRSLIKEDNPERVNSIYILAVMLERRRILAEKDIRKNNDGTVSRVYEHRKTGESIVIVDPMLDLAQLEHVQEEVTTLLSGGKQPAKEKHARPEDNRGEDS